MLEFYKTSRLNNLPGLSLHFWSNVLSRLAIVTAGPLLGAGTSYLPGPLQLMFYRNHWNNSYPNFAIFRSVFLFTWVSIALLVKCFVAHSYGISRSKAVLRRNVVCSWSYIKPYTCTRALIFCPDVKIVTVLCNRFMFIVYALLNMLIINK